MSLISVVHEYEILYSTRVVQKEKRWSDGRLKYYEFNRKMEVYSEDNVLVATEFYPHESKNPIANSVFADGVSLKFPSGKLIVEVTGYIGSSEREVTVKREVPVKQVSIKQEFQELLSTGDEFNAKQALIAPICVTKLPGSATLKRGNEKPRAHKPVGLRKPRSQKGGVDSTISLEAKLQEYDRSSKKNVTRVPPGSNRFSVRLRKELGLPQPSLQAGALQ